MNRIVLMFLAFLATLTIACSPVEPIAPEENLQSNAQASTQAFAPSVTRVVPLAWHSNPDWVAETLNGTAVRAVACGQAEPDLATWTQDLDAASLPQGARLEALWLSIEPCDGGRVVLPDNLPALVVDLVDTNSVTSVSSGAAQDQSQTPAEYVAVHPIFLNTFSLPTIDRMRYRVVVRFENEYGVDALSGMKITGLRIRYAPPI